MTRIMPYKDLDIRKKEEILNDFLYKLEKMPQIPEIKNFIAQYRKSHLFKITCIIDGILPFCKDSKKEIDDEIEYIKVIEENISNKEFRDNLIQIYETKKAVTDKIIRGILTAKNKS